MTSRQDVQALTLIYQPLQSSLEPWLSGLSGLSSIVGSCRALSGPCRAPVGLTLLTTVKQLSGTVGHVGAKVGCEHACVLSGTVGLSGCRAVGHVGACRGMSGHVGHVKAVGLSMWTSVCVLCSL